MTADDSIAAWVAAVIAGVQVEPLELERDRWMLLTPTPLDDVAAAEIRDAGIEIEVAGVAQGLLLLDLTFAAPAAPTPPAVRQVAPTLYGRSHRCSILSSTYRRLDLDQAELDERCSLIDDVLDGLEALPQAELVEGAVFGRAASSAEAGETLQVDL